MPPNWWEKYAPVDKPQRPNGSGMGPVNPMVEEGRRMSELVPLEMRGKPPSDASIKMSDFTGRPSAAPPKADTGWLSKYDRELSPEQEEAASGWANYLSMVRKNHGDRAVDVAGEGVVAASDDTALWRQAVAAAERSGWKAPPKAGVEAGVVAGLNDFSFGFSDEVASGFNAAKAFLWNLPGKGLEGAGKAAGDEFDLSMDQSNFALDQARQDQGGVALATGIGTALIPGIGLASRAANTARAAVPATTKLGKLWSAVKGGGKLAAGGAAMGELAGIGHARGDLGERVKEAGVEAPLFGLGGAFLGNAAGKALGGLIKKADDVVRPVFLSPENRSLFLIERAMKRDGVTLNDLMAAQRRVKAMGGDTLETLAELAAYSGRSTGKNLRGLARALHAQPGKASEMAEALIEKRRGSIHTGASKAVAAGTGQKVANYADQVADLEDQLTQSSKRAYDDFRASPVDPDIFDARIAPILSTEPGRMSMTAAARGMRLNAAAARSAGKTQLAQELDDAAAALERNSQPNINRLEPLPARALDEVKRAFDDQIETAGQRSYTGGLLRTAKNDLADHISSATGGAYGNALGTFSGGKRLREAIDAGYGIFNKKAWQLDELLEGTGGPSGILSQGEVEGIAFGFARALQDAIDGNDLAAVRRIMRDRGMQNKLAKIMGPNYPRFMSRVTRMLNRQDFDGFVAGGSPTARIQAELADAQGEDTMSRVLNNLGTQAANTGTMDISGAFKNAVIAPMAKGAGGLWNKLTYRGIGNESVNEELGKQMFTPMRDGAMRDFAGSFSAQPASRFAGSPDVLGRTGAVAGAQMGGREGMAMNSPEERADVLVEENDGAMLEEYLDPATTPERQRQIERHFGPQAAELWRLRASLSAPQ